MLLGLHLVYGLCVVDLHFFQDQVKAFNPQFSQISGFVVLSRSKKEVMLFSEGWTESLKSDDGVLGVKAAAQLFTQAKKPKQVVQRGTESTEGKKKTC